MKLGFDATFCVGNYRGMGKFVRQLLMSFDGDLIGFAPTYKDLNHDNPYNIIYEGNYIEPFWEQLKLSRMARDENVDFLLCGYNTSPIFSPLPTILVVHDLIFLNNYSIFDHSLRQYLGGKYRRLIISESIKRADRIITVSQTSKHEICDNFNIQESAVDVISNTIPDEWFDVDYEALHFKCPYFLTVSGGAPSKNLKNLLYAFSKAQEKESFRGIQLRIVGLNISEVKTYKKLAQKLQIHKFVIFHDHLNESELISLYQNALAVIAPSLAEGFGIPLLEALALGKILACSSIPIFQEIAGNHAIYFDPLSTEEIKNCLVLIASSIDVESDKCGRKNHAKKYSFSNRRNEAINFFKRLKI